MSRVSLLKVDSYDQDPLYHSIEKSFENIKFDPSGLRGSTVAVKPNLLTIASPEKGITTHPEFLRAVIKFIKHNGGEPILVESPAFIPLDKVLSKGGYMEILLEENVRISDTKITADLVNESGVKYKYFHVAEGLVKADYIFNLPKLKTHSLTYFTGALKNLFGSIHGLEKSKWHVRANNAPDFISFLLDLYGGWYYLQNRGTVHIMDGILGLEGEGPGSSGKPKAANAVIAGFDAIAVDSVAIRVAGLDLKMAGVCIEGERRGYGISSPEKITVTGYSVSDFSNNFVPSKSKSMVASWPFNSPFFKNLLVERPVPQPDKCTLCYQCRGICPAKAIDKSKDGKTPAYDYSKCIRCYCCAEICPEAAIELKKGFVAKLIG
ncbi:MAG TPA: DUF362 domain-containing protein [Spirochaetota bacterium]|nr:DUF362 domain-containing protein [Spirochaetota bacterium]HPJ33291.1 DUF362 domain-containing protein [Spirochaetota bacterium]